MAVTNVSLDLNASPLSKCDEDVGTKKASSNPNVCQTPSEASTLLASLPAVLSVNDFIFLAKLGEGTYGQVYLVRRKHTTRIYALKVISKAYIVNVERYDQCINFNQVMDEMRLLRYAGSAPFVMELRAAFHDSAHFFLLSDYCPTTLFDVCASREGALPPDLVKFYTAEVACAINQLHRLGIVHRDIKPENILIGVDGHVQLADFSYAHRLEDNPSGRPAGQSPPTTTGAVGTPGFVALEVMKGVPYSYSVDFFSLGVIIHMMHFGKYIWDDLVGKELLEAMINHPFIPLQNHSVDVNIVSLISGLLDYHPKTRFGFHELKYHAYFRGLNWKALLRRDVTGPDVNPLSVDYHAPLNAKEALKTVGEPYTPSKDPLPEFNYISSSNSIDEFLNVTEADITEEHETEASQNPFVLESTDTPSVCWDSSSSDLIQTPSVPKPFSTGVAVNVSPILHSPSITPAEVPNFVQDSSKSTFSDLIEDLVEGLITFGRLRSLDGEAPVFEAPKS